MASSGEPGATGSACDPDGTADRGSNSEQGLEQLGSSGPEQPRDADDLASMHGEAESLCRVGRSSQAPELPERAAPTG